MSLHYVEQVPPGDTPGGSAQASTPSPHHADLGRLKARIAELERELGLVMGERDALVRSKIWRYTAPLRRARTAAADAKRRVRNWRAKAKRVLDKVNTVRASAPAHAPGAQGLGVPSWDVPGQRIANLQLYATASNMARVADMQRQLPAPALDITHVTPGLTLCILNLDKPELIVPLVRHLHTQQAPRFAARGLGFEVIIGDTGSTDPAVLALYEQLPKGVRVKRGLRYQFSRCNNALAYGDAHHDTVLFLNNDVVLDKAPEALERMYDVLHASPDVGVVGPCMFFADGSVQHMGVDFLRQPETAGLCFHPHTRTRVDATALADAWEVPAVTGACLMIKRPVLLAAGGMDEGYAAECQDIALCLTAHRLGYTSRVLHVGPVVHLENATRKKGEENWSDRQRFLRQWGTYIEATFL